MRTPPTAVHGSTEHRSDGPRWRHGRRTASTSSRGRAQRAIPFVASAMTLAVLAACGSPRPEQTSLPPEAERGLRVVSEQGCASCHSTDGSTLIGPTWQGLWGTTIRLDDDSVVIVDAEYIRTAVRDPGAQRRPGAWIQMPSYTPIVLSETDLEAIIALIESLSQPAAA
jgi:mono/diheme cytochrome c family protein